MCGLYAINTIISALKQTEVTPAEIHALAKDMAQKECSLVYAQDAKTVLDMEVDPRGNFAADVLLHLLETRTLLKPTRWTPGHPILSSLLLIGSGTHWQAVLRHNDSLWFLFDQSFRKAVPDMTLLLEGKSKTGAVYQIGEVHELPDTGVKWSARVVTQLATPPPPGKRQKLPIFEGEFITGTVARKTGVKRRILSKEEQHSEMQLPEEFLANPRFDFEGPHALSSQEPIFDLIAAAVAPDEDSDEDPEPRPQRCRTQTHLYQAEEEVMREREKRAVKGDDKSKTE